MFVGFLGFIDVEFEGTELLFQTVVCQTTVLSYIAAFEEVAVVAYPMIQSFVIRSATL